MPAFEAAVARVAYPLHWSSGATLSAAPESTVTVRISHSPPSFPHISGDTSCSSSQNNAEHSLSAS
eukprot:9010811-Karenia_brevis.AAC.1